MTGPKRSQNPKKPLSFSAVGQYDPPHGYNILIMLKTIFPMKKILFSIVLATSAVGLLSCSSVTKAKDLKQDSIKCGAETTVWESLPPGEHNAYDVTVSFSKKGLCPRRVIVEDKNGALSTNDVTKSKPQTYPHITKITLQCVSSDSSFTSECAFTVNDVRRSPTDAAATVTTANLASGPVTCGTTVVAFTATNTDGADVTILWRSGSPCIATLTAIRAGGGGKFVTNTFIHDKNVDKELSSIRAALKISLECSGSSPGTTDCDYEIVETEYP